MPFFNINEHWSHHNNAVVCSFKYFDRRGEILEMDLVLPKIKGTQVQKVELVIQPSTWMLDDECIIIWKKEFMGQFDFKELTT